MQTVDINELMESFAHKVSDAPLDLPQQRKVLRLIGITSSISVGEILNTSEVWDHHSLKHAMGEHRAGRLKAWRQGAAQPNQEQGARLRILWLLTQLDQVFDHNISTLCAARPAARSRWDVWHLDDLMRQQRWDEICNLAVEQMLLSGN